MEPLAVAAAGLLAVTAVPYLAYLGLYVLVSPGGSPAAKRHHVPTVSVVLPTYNEAAIVERKLDDLLALDYPMDRVEVVVADASDDETPALVEAFFEGRPSPRLQLIEEDERRGLASALNDAYAAASNDIVVKTDCDSRLYPDALREAVANLADPSIGAVTGRNVDVLGGSEVEAGYRDVQSRLQQLESHLDSTFIFHGPFSAFDRDAIVPVDADSLADDTELALRIRRGGKRAVFDPAVRFAEAAHSGFWKRRRQKDRRAMGLLRVLVRHRDALGRYGRYGRVVLPFNWWFMVISPWLLLVDGVAVTAAAVSAAGAWGLAFPTGVAAFTWLGQRDRLGPAQAVYSVLDTQVSLLRAAVALIAGAGDGTWEVDAELREAYK